MTPMNEPIWEKAGRKLRLLMPDPPYLHRRLAGRIIKHPRKRLYHANCGGFSKQFHDLDEAKAWLLAIARLEDT